ncbi:MAG: WG repeat-containing protein [Saprospiraceae bacterium]|nr:WG repeat-containing protein [Saprospiraceae bacterium]
MIIRFLIFAIILVLGSCTSNTNQSDILSYHFFRDDGKIGIVDSKGTITCEPKFDGEIYFPSEFNNIQRSKFSSIFDNKRNKSHVIDIYGNEPFPDLKKVRQVSYGDFAIYFDDYQANKGLHVVSLRDKKEVGHYKNSRGVNFHGTTKYFYAIVENRKWKLFNEEGEQIYENGFILEVFVIEEGNKFKAVALSSGPKIYAYLNAEGNQISPFTELEKAYADLLQQREKEANRDYNQYEYEILSFDGYANSVEDLDVVKGIKYSSGEEIYFVKKDNKMGVVDSKGKTILKFEYDKVETAYDLIKLHKGGKIGLADLKGNRIYAPIFKALRYEPYSARYLELVYKNYWFEADLKGRIFAPEGVVIE